MTIQQANEIGRRAQAAAGLKPARHRLHPNQLLNPKLSIRGLYGQAYAFVIHLDGHNPNAVSVSTDTPDLEQTLTDKLTT